VVAARKGTDKVNKAARRPHVKIVRTEWLVECLVQWKRLKEGSFLLDVDRPDQSRILVDENGEAITSSEGEEFNALLEESNANNLDSEDGAETDDMDEAPPTEPITPLPKEMSPEAEKAMYEEFEDFLGSDNESGTESDASESGAPSTTSTPGKRKRKRNTDSANSTDAEDSDASANGGSKLQRRKKQAMERTTSLTNVTSADKSSGLPSPDTTGPEEDKEAGAEAVEGNETDDLDDAALEAEMMAELEKESDVDEG